MRQGNWTVLCVVYDAFLASTVESANLFVQPTPLSEQVQPPQPRHLLHVSPRISLHRPYLTYASAHAQVASSLVARIQLDQDEGDTSTSLRNIAALAHSLNRLGPAEGPNAPSHPSHRGRALRQAQSVALRASLLDAASNAAASASDEPIAMEQVVETAASVLEAECDRATLDKGAALIHTVARGMQAGSGVTPKAARSLLASVGSMLAPDAGDNTTAVVGDLNGTANVSSATNMTAPEVVRALKRASLLEDTIRSMNSALGSS